MATNKEKVLGLIPTLSKYSRDEINYHLNDVDHEEIPDYGMIDAFEDAAESLERMVGRVPADLKKFYIDLGYCVAVDITKVVSTGKKYWFIYEGQHFQVVDSWENWIKN